MGGHTAKSRLSRAQVSKSDNLALYAVDRGVFESAGRKFVEVGSQFGLTVSIPKTKGLAMGTICDGDGSPVDVGTGMVEMVKNFTYLGSNLSIVRQLVKSSEGLLELLKLLVPCKYQYFLIVIYLLY